MKITTVNGTSAPSDSDLAELAEAPRAIMRAWGDHDGAAFAQMFTEEGSMVLPGVEVIGRPGIETFMSQAFAGPYEGTQVIGEPARAIVFGPDHVTLFTVGGVRAAGAAELSEKDKVRAQWTLVRTADGWRIASYQNTPMAAPESH